MAHALGMLPFFMHIEQYSAFMQEAQSGLEQQQAMMLPLMQPHMFDPTQPLLFDPAHAMALLHSSGQFGLTAPMPAFSQNLEPPLAPEAFANALSGFGSNVEQFLATQSQST